MGTLSTWSSAIVWVGAVLQTGLLLLLVRRKRVAEVPVFATLSLFYVARSVLLPAMVRHVPRPAYNELYSGLSLVDFVLQIALAGELLRGIVKRRRLLVGVASLLAAAAVTAGLILLLPSRSSVPADRGTIFTGVLFAILFSIAVRTRLRGWLGSVAAGMALIGVSETIAACGKSVAAFHHDGRTFLIWSYGNAAVYLLTLGYWIVASTRSMPLQEQGSRNTADARVASFGRSPLHRTGS